MSNFKWIYSLWHWSNQILGPGQETGAKATGQGRVSSENPSGVQPEEGWENNDIHHFVQGNADLENFNPPKYLR